MLTQPPIMQLVGAQWVLLGRNNWNLASQQSLAGQISMMLQKLGVSKVRVIDMTDYVDDQMNFRNDIVGMFQYLDLTVGFLGVLGVIQKDGEPDVPIYEAVGGLWDRQTKPSAFFDKIAPIIIGGNQEPFPNGAHLKIQSYPAEGIATLYWDYQE
jgi:hypothetical protein